MPSSFFSARNLVVSHGQIKALHGVSVDVELGEVVTLIGANGSGKSTFLKTVAGLLQVNSGEILFQGESLAHLQGHKITQKGIVLVPEGRRIFPLLTVEENLLMGAFFRGHNPEVSADRDRIYELFPRLKERVKQLAGTLSGGEQQMLAIGRALMGRPKLLMLDEPSMGLAPVIVEKIFEIIETINKQGVTVLLVEQNARAALSIASRGYVLETGSILLEDSTKNLLINEKVKQCYLGVEEIHIK